MDQPSSSRLNRTNTNPPFSSGAEHNATHSDFTPDSSRPSFMADFAEATHDLLMDESVAGRVAAAHRLAELGRPIASPYLVAALSDSAWEVREAAVESLGHVGEPEAIAPLQNLLDRGDQDALLQRAISLAIQAISARAPNSSATPIVAAIDTSQKEFSQPDQDMFPPNGQEIGRASCRERVYSSV